MYYIPTACVSLQIRENHAIKVSRMYSSDVNIEGRAANWTPLKRSKTMAEIGVLSPQSGGAQGWILN